MAHEVDNRKIFDDLSTKISNLIYGRTEGDRNHINKTLEDLNILDYRHPIVTNVTKAVLLLHQCCTLIPPDDSFLVAKCCQLITNLVSRQLIQIEGRTFSVALQWCLQALKHSEDVVTLDILIATDALLRSSAQCIHVSPSEIITADCSLLEHAQRESVPEVVLLSVQCLEACTVLPGDTKNLSNTEKCSQQNRLLTDVFMKYLLKERTEEFDILLYYKLVISSLNGLQNIILQDGEFLNKELGLMLGIAKAYMSLGLKDIKFIIPQKIMPSTLRIPEPSANVPREKKGGKIAKQRKHRISGAKKDVNKSEEWTNNSPFRCYMPANDLNSTTVLNFPGYGSIIKTSDSDFSDTESGRIVRLGITEGRVRQAALSLLLSIVKLTAKRTMFCYWSSFIPDGLSTGMCTLTTCILKDPSPRGRMAALSVLLNLLTSAKLYLSQAESSDKSTSFTPFSAVLGCMLKELHRCLCFALNENSIPVLTQALKCLAALIQATPYHRLTPGIILKVVRNAKLFVKHRDATVQVAALIVLGCVLSSEHLLCETKQAMLKQTTIKKAKVNIAVTDDSHQGHSKHSFDKDLECVDYSSDEEQMTYDKCNSNIPWLLKICLFNLGIVFEDQATENIVPAPVKLESLQVISAMSRNYFSSLMAPSFNYITKALDISLSDSYIDLRLHAGRTIDFIGQAINQHFGSQEMKELTIEQGLIFWQTLINGSLTSLLQNEHHSTLRAVGCDCLGSIGPHIFEHLPRDKQILCVTLLFACSRDDENSVKGAAVRALAIWVLYPSLREDPGFVVDTSAAIHRTLQEDSVLIKVKASWSLGNLSDALVLNSTHATLEKFPNNLLLKLFNVSIKVANVNDKIKSNIVRAVGNMFLLITEELMAQNDFKTAAQMAITVLVKNASSGTNMKVRWNSCYAIGNVLKNQALYRANNTWLKSVYFTLLDLVKNFRNFKVRINAALALSSPSSREHYGQYYFSVWTGLLNALENSQHMEDYNEYKHRDHLVDQICLSIGHLTTFAVVEDFSTLNDSVIFHLESLKQQMHRVLERLVPEKSTVLSSASAHITTLLSHPDLANDHKQTLVLFLDIFNVDLL